MRGASTSGWEVVHLVEPDRVQLHRPPPFLRLDGDHLRYDVVP